MKALETKIDISNTPKSLFKDKEHYLRFRAAWKQALNNPDTKHKAAVYHTLYAMFRGKDWTKCFTPITNPNKLANGMTPDATLMSTLRTLNVWFSFPKGRTEQQGEFFGDLAMFKGIITAEMLIALGEKFIPTAKMFAENHKPYRGEA